MFSFGSHKKWACFIAINGNYWTIANCGAMLMLMFETLKSSSVF